MAESAEAPDRSDGSRLPASAEVSVLEPVGARISGLALDDLEAAHVGRLKQLLADHGVLVIPGQDVDDAAFVAFLRLFGELTFTKGETAAAGFPDLNVVSNVGRTSPPRSSFHVDTSYVRNPPAYTALRGVTIPAQGGATQFSNQYRAFETLPAELRGELEGRTIRHVVSGLELGDEDETSAEHPIFRPHPLTGRIALYMSTPQRCAAISGLAPAPAEAMVARLFEHSTAAANVYRHEWSPGEIVIWDNACVLHRADHSDVVGDRVMHRGMVASHGEVASSRPAPAAT